MKNIIAVLVLFPLFLINCKPKPVSLMCKALDNGIKCINEVNVENVRESNLNEKGKELELCGLQLVESGKIIQESEDQLSAEQKIDLLDKMRKPLKTYVENSKNCTEDLLKETQDETSVNRRVKDAVADYKQCILWAIDQFRRPLCY